jgi:hypothetical protein
LPVSVSSLNSEEQLRWKRRRKKTREWRSALCARVICCTDYRVHRSLVQVSTNKLFQNRVRNSKQKQSTEIQKLAVLGQPPIAIGQPEPIPPLTDDTASSRRRLGLAYRHPQGGHLQQASGSSLPGPIVSRPRQSPQPNLPAAGTTAQRPGCRAPPSPRHRRPPPPPPRGHLLPTRQLFART